MSAEVIVQPGPSAAGSRYPDSLAAPAVRTVLGDVDPGALGRVSAHEHIVFTGGLGTIVDPEFRLDNLDKICADVAEFARAGGGTIVDAMPLVEGRRASMLGEVATRTGVQVIGATGFHRLQYYTEAHWLYHYPTARLAELLIAEITTGMDDRCHNGPDPAPTDSRAGVLKLAAELHHIPHPARRLFEAAGAAHRATGVPVLVHLEQGTAGHEVLDLLAANDVPADRVLLSHADRNPDPGYHAELAQRGAFLGYDWFARTRRRPDSVVSDLVAAPTVLSPTSSPHCATVA